MKKKFKTPKISNLPKGLSKKLVDDGLSYFEATISGFAERYGRGETSHTIHVWWARRPHKAMRALIYACLIKEPKEHHYNQMVELCKFVTPPRLLLEESRKKIKEKYEANPKVLDMFGGGGTIPYESSNLGADTYSIDSNELSVFIQKCNLIYSQKSNDENISNIIQSSGTKVLKDLSEETQCIFPLRGPSQNGYIKEGPCAYLWTYKKKCGYCGFKFFLTKRPWLSKKKGNFKIISFDYDSKEQIPKHKILLTLNEYISPWIKNKSSVICPKCKSITNNIKINQCEDYLIALVHSSRGKGKSFFHPAKNSLPSKSMLTKMEKQLAKEMNIHIPRTFIPKWSGIMNPTLYGINTHSEFLSPRQRVVLLVLIKNLLLEFDRIKKQYDLNTAKYTIGALSSLIDQIIDWNCRLSMWIPQNEQVGRAFCGPGVSMIWDYAEIDPVLTGPSNLWSKLNRIVAGVKSISNLNGKCSVDHAVSQNLPFKNNFFDAIITDPPYYDNLYYCALADFFYSWKRIVLKKIDPILFKNKTTTWKHELVSSKERNGSSEKAHKIYSEELTLSINESSRVLKKDGIFSFIYSHKAINAWESFVNSFYNSPFIITSVQPLSVERKHRPRAMKSEAVNTCLAFISRKTSIKKSAIDLTKIYQFVFNLCEGEFVKGLKDSGWNEEDIALVIFANGISKISNKKNTTDLSIREILIEIEKIINNFYKNFKLSKRNSI